jgi:predicted S18 family serine protease
MQKMYNKNIKLVIAILIIAYAVYQFIEGYIGNGIMFIFLSLIFIFLYFKNEFILLAFLKLRKQDFDGAKKWLDKIKNPQSALTTKQQGYYNYLNGIMVSQTNMNEAEKYFKNAILLGLSMDHDLAMAKLNLAGIAFTKRRKQEANLLLAEAQKLDKRGILTEQIKMMKQQMKKASIPNQHYGAPTSARQGRRSRR